MLRYDLKAAPALGGLGMGGSTPGAFFDRVFESLRNDETEILDCFVRYNKVYDVLLFFPLFLNYYIHIAHTVHFILYIFTFIKLIFVQVYIYTLHFIGIVSDLTAYKHFNLQTLYTYIMVFTLRLFEIDS